MLGLVDGDVDLCVGYLGSAGSLAHAGFSIVELLHLQPVAHLRVVQAALLLHLQEVGAVEVGLNPDRRGKVLKEGGLSELDLWDLTDTTTGLAGSTAIRHNLPLVFLELRHHILTRTDLHYQILTTFRLDLTSLKASSTLRL